MAPLRRSFTAEDFEPVVAGAGVESTVLVQSAGVSAETHELLARAASMAGVAAVVGWVDLTGDVPGALAALSDSPDGRWLRGIRHQVEDEVDPGWLRRRDVRRGLRAVADAGLPYDLLVASEQLPAAIETVAALPDLRFVLDHAAKPPIASHRLEPWASDVRTLARMPNVTCKLSGLVTQADWYRWDVEELRRFADVVLEAFTPGRLMFGSDWPVCLLAASYAEVCDAAGELTASLSVDERVEVFGGTAHRVYELA